MATNVGEYVNVTISVGYRFIDGYHVFTSKDIRGLYVASRDPRKAYESVGEVLQALVARQTKATTVEIVPTLTFEEWVNLRQKGKPEEAAKLPILGARDFMVRLAAAATRCWRRFLNAKPRHSA